MGVITWQLWLLKYRRWALWQLSKILSELREVAWFELLLQHLLLFFFSCRGVLKYQTNLEEHPPGCFNPNKTLLGNMTVPKPFEELFPDYTTEPFPEDLTFPEPLVQSNFMRICSKEPKFQSHFPEVCMIRHFRYYKPCQVFQSAITTNYCFSRPDVLIMENIIKTFSGIQRSGGEKNNLY